MNYIVKTIGFITISILLIGCSGGSAPSVKYNPADGLVDTPEEKQRIAKLINSHSNVKSVFKNILKIQGKDKYENNADYLKRMSGFTTYAVMELDSSGAWYDTEAKLYLIPIDSGVIWSSDKLGASHVSGWRCTRGNCSTTGQYFSETRSLELTQRGKIRSSSYIGSNAYGASARVDAHESKTYVAHLDNIVKLLKSKNMYLAKDRRGSGSFTEYFIGFPVSKEKAKYLDRQRKKLKTKIRVQPTNMGTSLYYSVSGTEATLDSPTEYYTSTKGFDAHLKELVMYDANTKEILFQFAD